MLHNPGFGKEAGPDTEGQLSAVSERHRGPRVRGGRRASLHQVTRRAGGLEAVVVVARAIRGLWGGCVGGWGLLGAQVLVASGRFGTVEALQRRAS